MKGVLILGANSRIGKAIASAMTNQARLVLVARRGADVTREHETHLVEAYDQLPPACLRNIETIINCVGLNSNDPSVLSHVNVDIPTRVARIALDAGASRFAQISSFSVFGNAECVDERAAVLPISNYGRSKAQAERALSILARSGLNLTLFRFPILYGMGAHTKLTRLATVMASLRMFPAPQSRPLRSVLHVQNAAAVVADAVARNAEGIIYAADRDPFEIEALATVLRVARGLPIRIVRVPDATFLPVRFIAPSTFASLFRPSLLSPDLNAANALGVPMTLKQGLTEIVIQMLDEYSSVDRSHA